MVEEVGGIQLLRHGVRVMGQTIKAKWELGSAAFAKGSKVKCCIRVGLQWVGGRRAISNRPELSRSLIGRSVGSSLTTGGEKEDLLYLYICDNQAALTEVNGWIGEGGRATLAITPNVDIMREVCKVLCMLRARIETGCQDEVSQR